LPIRRSIQRVRDDLRRIRQPGSFARNSFEVLSGNALAMASQLILTPIIARIYGPEAYGMYGLYMALMMNLASVSDLGYSMAYVLPRDEDRFLQLVRFNFLTAGIVAVVVIGLTLNTDLVYSVFPDWKVLGGWIHLVGPAAALYALSVIFTQWLTRAKEFKASAFTGATLDLSMRVFNVGFGWITKGLSFGLMLSDLLMRTLILPLYLKRLSRHGLHKLLHGWSWTKIKAAIHEYRRYPLLIFPERWVSMLGLQLPTFLLAGDMTAVGHFGLGASLMLIPLRLLGFSFSTVYLQKAAEIVDDAPDELRRLTKGLYSRLFWLGIGPFLLMVFFADEAFAILFGAPWRDAGVITAYLGGFFFFRLLTDPMVSLFNVLRREHVMLVFGLIMLALRAAGMSFALYHDMGSGTVIMIYAMLSFLGQIVLSVILLNAARLNGLWLTFRSLLVIIVLAVVAASLRMALLGTWWPPYAP
jgi:O-antigen/teichoic acid export membrane protein